MQTILFFIHILLKINPLLHNLGFPLIPIYIFIQPRHFHSHTSCFAAMNLTRIYNVVSTLKYCHQLCRNEFFTGSVVLFTRSGIFFRHIWYFYFHWIQYFLPLDPVFSFTRVGIFFQWIWYFVSPAMIFSSTATGGIFFHWIQYFLSLHPTFSFTGSGIFFHRIRYFFHRIL